MNRFKHLCYVKEKTKTARDNGYIDYYDMVQSEYKKLKSISKTAKICQVSSSSIWDTLKVMGIPRGSRGGANFKGAKTMNKKSQLLWMAYPEDKLKIAEEMGYKSFYEMLLGENKKGKNAHEIERACGMSYVQVNKLLRALGGTIKPRGGYNGRKSS